MRFSGVLPTISSGTGFCAMRGFIIRNRTSILDIAMFLVAFAAATYFAYKVDIFPNEAGVGTRANMIERDELLLLGWFFALGLFCFALRRNNELRRESRRRLSAEQEARQLAFQDVLTGLANRRKFNEAIKVAIDSPPRAGAAHALFLLDLNGFKRINDVYGHGIGDEVLKVVAQRLVGVSREGDIVARFGGDEFAILAKHLVSAEAATTIAIHIIQALEAEIILGGVSHRVGAGIGIALIPSDATTVQEAIRKADVALYRAKAENRSALRFFEESMDQTVHERHEIERELRNAIAKGDVTVLFRPSFNLETQDILGFEVVPRWIHPRLGEVPPERFLPIAEETGVVHVLAEHILRSACAVAVYWPPEITLSVNIFPGQLTSHHLSSRVLQTLSEFNFNPSRLEIEITESDLVRNLQSAKANFDVLREKGVTIALDNFGAGYSTLYHLRNFKLDKVKIDRSFIENMAQPENAAIIRALIGLGHGLGLTISAEGIENAGQRMQLLVSGCEEGQGYLLNEPLSASATTKLFEGTRRTPQADSPRAA
jgi:diguanylate cyclase (GGDEF)-like protein